MHFQFEMAQQAQPAAAAPGDPAATSVELLRALLEVQHEQLQLTKAAAAAHDAGARWRAVLARSGASRTRVPKQSLGTRANGSLQLPELDVAERDLHRPAAVELPGDDPLVGHGREVTVDHRDVVDRDGHVLADALDVVVV